MSKLYWGRTMAQTDIGGLWCYAKVRPRAYWLLRRIRLFALIVWRRYDPGCDRLDWRTAWDVAACAEGLGPCEVHRGRPPA